MVTKRKFKNIMFSYDFIPTYQVDVELFLYKKKRQLFKKIYKHYKKHGGIKFQISLNVKLGKYKITTEEYHEICPWFQSCIERIFSSHYIHRKIEECLRTILAFYDNFLQMGSGWFLEEILMVRLDIYKYNPLGGCCKVELPIELKFKKSLLNIKCNDNKCFLYCILAALNKRTINQNHKNSYLKYINSLNISSLSFPTMLNQIPKFEKHNNLTINVFGMFKNNQNNLQPFPMYISENFNEKYHHINLLLYKNHYILIRNIHGFIRPFFWKRTRFFCYKCLQSFCKSSDFRNHKNIDCTNTKYTGQAYKLPAEGTKLKFNDYSKQIKNPFVIYADFETYNQKEAELRKKGNSVYKSKHVLNAFGAILISKYEKLSKKPYIYIGKNVIKNFIEYIYQIRAEISHILDNKRKPLEMTPEDILHLATQKNCYLCGIKFKKGIKKVVDHAHLGREGKGRDVNYACNTCNLVHSALKMNTIEIPIIMHNAMNYDMHFLVQNLYNYIKSNISVLPRSCEKFLTLSFDNFKIIDSYQFLFSSLSNLANLLSKPEQTKENKHKQTMDNFIYTKKHFCDPHMWSYVIKKGVMCYDYIDSWKVLKETELPPHEKFYNDLTESNITKEEYKHAQDVFFIFKCKNIKDYLKLYLKIDVLLLCDVFESFREKSLINYALDPAKFLTAPALSYQAMLKKTGIKLELFSDISMYTFIENGIRGGMTNVAHRHAKTENENEHIVYWDCTNLYGYAMSQPLPYKNFEWLNPDTYEYFDVMSIEDDNKFGYILEVTLDYPKHLHDLHDMYPLAPEKLNIEYSNLSPYALSVIKKCEMKYKNSGTKLMSTLKPKKNYIIHYRNLKLYLSLGMVLQKIHKILKFNQKAWMKPYIDYNTNQRKLTTSSFEKEFFKLMNNSAFGKCMENVKKRVQMQLTSCPKKCEKLIRKPTFQSMHIFQNDFVGIQYKKPIIYLNKPIYLGFSILDLSKLHMFDFHYNKILPSFGLENVQLLYTDTDSLIYMIKHEHFLNILKHDLENYFDFSNLPENHPLYNKKNYKVLGTFKDETGGKKILEILALKPKMYCIECEDGKMVKRIKGIKKTSISKINKYEFKNALYGMKKTMANYISIRSFKHEVYTMQEKKLALTPFEDKRWLCLDGIKSRAYGHYKIIERKRKVKPNL